MEDLGEISAEKTNMEDLGEAAAENSKMEDGEAAAESSKMEDVGEAAAEKKSDMEDLVAAEKLDMEGAGKVAAEKKSNSEASPQKKDANPVFLENLVEMGMGKRLAKKALVCTENKSIDAALAWIAELGAEEMEALCESSDNESPDSDEWEDCDEEDDFCYKMVFVVNTELNMGVGKVASQVGHAVLGLYRLLMEDKEKYEASLEEWEEFGERKITLKAKNSQELITLQKKAETLHLPTYLVQDAGKTQIPIGSTTVLAIFGDEEAVNEITGKLKLL
ncbi:probable peptidyl-tRNA hydrolase 2 [Palaemon carinicauda]|uniref:probable peptidyl-tRNA hydrolase 2 n=1 Tax=Palaemon carinicauda TaxID=392227 RepID=UPI0035B62979